MRTLRFRPSLPSCVNRKVSDERPKKTLEMGDFPLHILENRRKERLAELKAECLELKVQLSEHSLQAALLKEAELDESSVCSSNDNKGSRVLSGRHSKSMHELRRAPKNLNGSSTLTIFSEEAFRRRREERLKTLRRELEDFAIKYSIGEYAEQIEGIEKSPLKKSKSVNLETLNASAYTADMKNGHIPQPGPLQGADDTINAAILLRIQRQREQELQRARLELKHLAFRLKHKLDEESGTPALGATSTGA